MKQIKFSIVITILFIYCGKLSSQIIPEWTANYASNYPVSINQNDMVTDKNGNVYITGYTRDTSYNYNVVTLKYDASGQFQWIQYYDSISYYTKITIDDIGNVYISGHYSNALITIKYSSQGVLQWVKSYLSTSSYTWAWDIIADDLGSVYMIGNSNGNRITTIKYNTSGILQWAVLDSVANGLSNSYITLDNNKNVYVTGRGDTLGYASACKTIKYNSAGVHQWSRIYTSNFNPGLSGPRDLKYDSNGFVYLLANTTNNNNGDGDYVVVKYDTLGNHLWTLPYSFTTYYDVPNSMVIDRTGNVYVTGNIWPTGGTLDSIVTIKISKSGILKWKKMYSLGYNNNDEASGIAIDSTGYIYVAGKSSDSFSRENFVTIKYDSLGNEIWVGRYKNTLYGSDIANTISIDKFGNIYISGTTYDTNSSGILTIKYSNAVGINELSNISDNIISIYPNPFETSLTLNANKYLKEAELFIYDELGKEVVQIKNINSQTISIQRNNLTSGIYFYRLIENNQVIAKGKIIAK
jgi:hypothetical protein